METPQLGNDSLKTGSGIPANLSAALAYLCTFITGLIFLVLEKENREVRFHAWQSIFFGVAVFVLQIVIGMLHAILGSLFGLLGGVVSVVGGLLNIGVFVLWVICMVKAYKLEHFKLPVVGDLAENQTMK